MPDTALPLTNKIIRQSTASFEAFAIQAKFADGLSQSAPNGLNAITEVWELTWRLNQSEFNTLMAVLRTAGTWGVLTWTTPYEAQALRWKIKSSSKVTWKRAGTGNAKFEVNCTLEQYHGI